MMHGLILIIVLTLTLVIDFYRWK